MSPIIVKAEIYSVYLQESKAFPTKEARVDPNLPLAAISDDETFDDMSNMQDCWKDFEGQYKQDSCSFILDVDLQLLDF